MSNTGIVFDIQRASLHDGPGLRTTIFFKGCPLRCAWCHNPESQKLERQYGKSGKIYGREISVEALMETVLADRAFYENSGGGMTLSGGEPMMQFAFCLNLLKAAKAEGLHTCLDTSGHFPADYLPEILPWVDLFHFDWKLSCHDSHSRWTGVDGQLIRENLESLIRSDARLILRCLIIPGVNDSLEHDQVLLEWESHPRIEAVERLRYHPTGLSKYDDLGYARPVFEC